MDSGRELNQEYQDKLVNRCLGRLLNQTVFFGSGALVYTTIKAIRYVLEGYPLSDEV